MNLKCFEMYIGENVTAKLYVVINDMNNYVQTIYNGSTHLIPYESNT